MLNIHESSEDYLEAILMLRESIGTVRSIDIVNKMNYSKPSVSIAMKKLRENGFITVDEDGFITLLPPGQEIAERIYDRHRLISSFLQTIGVEKEVADEEACKIEHDISDETVEKIRTHLTRMQDRGCRCV